MGDFVKLGKDVFGLILIRLPIADISRVAQLCKYTHAETQKQSLWRRLIERDFGAAYDGDQLQIYKEELEFNQWRLDRPSFEACVRVALKNGLVGHVGCIIRRGIQLDWFAIHDIEKYSKYLNIHTIPVVIKIPGINPQTVMETVCISNDYGAVKWLLENEHVNPAICVRKVLNVAIRYHRLSIFKLLLTDARIKIDADMLYECAFRGYRKFTRFLLENFVFDKQVVNDAESGAKNCGHKKMVRMIRRLRGLQTRRRE